MAQLLFVVEDAIIIEGHGIALFPGIAPEGIETFRAGDSIRLRKPDNSSIVTRIGGLALIHGNSRGLVAVFLEQVAKADVPPGTEVWSLDDE